VVCLRFVGLFFTLEDARDLRVRDVEDNLLDPEGGLEPDWKGLSSENGLCSASRDSLFNRRSGSSSLTEGCNTACAGALLRDRRTVVSTSGSVSDARGVLVVPRRLGVLDLLEVEGVAAAVDPGARSDLLFLLRGVFGAGGGGISCLSSSSSSSKVLS
jgi:hypothetical protein